MPMVSATYSQALSEPALVQLLPSTETLIDTEDGGAIPATLVRRKLPAKPSILSYSLPRSITTSNLPDAGA